MNRVVLDGYNLILRIPELRVVEKQAGLERARDELERALAGYVAGRKGVAALVVYDSSAPQGPGSGGRGLPGVTVRFSPLADTSVVELSRDFAGRGDSVLAVSSDRSGVAGPLAGTARVRVVSSEEFWRGLAGRGKGGPPSSESGKGEKRFAPAVSSEKPLTAGAGEVAYWLQAFGGEDSEHENDSRGGEKKARARETGPELRETGKEDRLSETELKKAINKEKYLRRFERGKRK